MTVIRIPAAVAVHRHRAWRWTLPFGAIAAAVVRRRRSRTKERDTRLAEQTRSVMTAGITRGLSR